MGIVDILPAWLGGKKKAPVAGGVKITKNWTKVRIESSDQSEQAADMTRKSIKSILENQDEADVTEIDIQRLESTKPGLFRASGTVMVDPSKVKLINDSLEKIGGLSINPKE